MSDVWWNEILMERAKYDILAKLVIKYKQWHILEEFWTYFEGTGWEQTKVWEEEE